MDQLANRIGGSFARTVVVTGASRGLGRALVERFVTEGDFVYALASTDEVLYASQTLRASGRCEAIVCDIRDEAQVAGTVQKVMAQSGRIDVLINNAGVGYFKPLEEYTVEEAKHIFDVNVLGLFFMTKHVLPHMKRAGDGIILNISSDVARRTFAGGSLYVASKYAVQGLTGCLAQEARPYGVRVGTLNPGMIDTYFAGGEQGAAGKEAFLQVEQLADVIAYIARAPKSVVFDEIVLHPMIQEYGLS